MICGFTFPAYAHNSDYFSGIYTGIITHQNLKFRIESSAITSFLTSSVYYSAYGWSNVSNSVGSIGIAIASPGMPSSGFYSVYGQWFTDGTLGETIPRDSSGNIVSMGSNWYSLSITMNTNSSSFSGADNATTAAKKTFTHEVGHALKLSHPAFGYSIPGHTYQGLPKAVMNQGLTMSSKPWISSTVVTHDISNLQTKWGS